MRKLLFISLVTLVLGIVSVGRDGNTAEAGPIHQALPDGYTPGVIRGAVLGEKEVVSLAPEVLPNGEISTPSHRQVLTAFRLDDLAAERDRVLQLHDRSLKTLERENGRLARVVAESALTADFDAVLARYPASNSPLSSFSYEWTGQCWVPVITRLTGVNLSRASWGAPCGSESDPVTTQWWMGASTANTRTILGGWEGTGACLFNPIQYLWLDTGAALGWFANSYSLAKGLSFPYSPACGHRAHVRMWSVPPFVVGYLTFGIPHREQVNGGGHTVLSWNDGIDKLYTDYTSYPWGNGGTYYCGWVWAGTYGSGGYVGCGIELTWSP